MRVPWGDMSAGPERPERDEQAKHGIALSMPQLAASGLATLTTTVGCSFFGVQGTVIGAAVASVATTGGSVIYEHFFNRTSAVIKTAGQQVGQAVQRRAVPGAPRAARPGPADRGRTGRGAGPGSAGAENIDDTPTFRRPADPDAPLRPPSDPDRPRASADDPTRVFRAPADPDRTERLSRADDSDAGDPGSAEPMSPDDAETVRVPAATSGADEPGEGAPSGTARRRRYLLPAAALSAAVIVFAVVMGVVTLVEKGIDKPLSAALRGTSGSGTSLDGGHTGHKPDHHRSPGPTPSGSVSPSGVPTATTAPSTAPSNSPAPTVGSTPPPTSAPARTPASPSGPQERSQAPRPTGPVGNAPSAPTAGSTG